MDPDLSISIVSLNRPDLVRQCLESVEAHTRSIRYEVHLVAHGFDPGPLRALQDRWPAMVTHPVSGVRGFSQNHNVALRAATGRYAVILNDDTIVSAELFGRMVEFLDAHADVVAAFPVLRNPDGTVQLGIRGRFTPMSFVVSELKVGRVPLLRQVVRPILFDRIRAPSGDAGPTDVDAGTGACFMVRREALQAIGYLDESYFLGPDDIDWTVRLRRHAGRVVLLPDLSITHLGGATLGKAYQAVLPAVYAGCYEFFRRYYGRASEVTVRLIVGLAWSALLGAGWWAVWAATSSSRARLLSRARFGCVRYALSKRASPEVFARLADVEP